MTVYRLCEKGEIPSFRVGNSIRIPRENFDRWLNKKYGTLYEDFEWPEEPR